MKYSLVYSFFAKEMAGFVHRREDQDFFTAASEHLGPKLNLNPAWLKIFLLKICERKTKATKLLVHLLRGVIQVSQNTDLREWHVDEVPTGGWRGELAVWDKKKSLSTIHFRYRKRIVW